MPSTTSTSFPPTRSLLHEILHIFSPHHIQTIHICPVFARIIIHTHTSICPNILVYPVCNIPLIPHELTTTTHTNNGTLQSNKWLPSALSLLSPTYPPPASHWSADTAPFPHIHSHSLSKHHCRVFLSTTHLIDNIFIYHTSTMSLYTLPIIHTNAELQRLYSSMHWTTLIATPLAITLYVFPPRNSRLTN